MIRCITLHRMTFHSISFRMYMLTDTVQKHKGKECHCPPLPNRSQGNKNWNGLSHRREPCLTRPELTELTTRLLTRHCRWLWLLSRTSWAFRRRSASGTPLGSLRTVMWLSSSAADPWNWNTDASPWWPPWVSRSEISLDVWYVWTVWSLCLCHFGRQFHIINVNLLLFESVVSCCSFLFQGYITPEVTGKLFGTYACGNRKRFRSYRCC